MRSLEITQAKSDLANAKYQADIYVKIDAAIAASDDEGLLRLVEDAEAHGLKGPKITQAKVLSNRTKAIEDAKEKIAQGSAKSDLGLLNEGLEMAIQLGLNTPETATATELRDMLQENEAKFDELKAAMKTLKIKTESPSGIVASDIAPLEAVFASAKAQAVPPKAKEMVDAETAIKNAKAQLEVQAALDKALAMSPMTIEALREAVDVADDLELGLATQKKAKEELKKMGDKRQAEKQARAEAGEDDDEPVADVDEMKAKREAQLKQAEAPRFKLAAFDGLRKPEEYAKGTIMHKKAMKEGMLVWSGKQIPRSLTSLPTDKNKLAMGIFKALLGYMGDKQMQYPATLAQDVLKQGVEIPELRDEIYIQMMKQLTQNQVAASILKGWQLMCMCTSTFPPTTSFENFLLNFMITQSKKHGIVGNYAAYCMRTLQGMLEAGASGFLPSIEEIMAYDERPPVLATIALVDGMILTEDLPVTPDLNAGKVAEICAQFLELEDERADTFGIFVYDLGLSGEDDLVEGLPVHHGVTCDVSGMAPIVGPRYTLPDRDYDLCEAEFLKLDPAERIPFVRIERPDDRPQSAAKSRHKFTGRLGSREWPCDDDLGVIEVQVQANEDEDYGPGTEREELARLKELTQKIRADELYEEFMRRNLKHDEEAVQQQDLERDKEGLAKLRIEIEEQVRKDELQQPLLSQDSAQTQVKSVAVRHVLVCVYEVPRAEWTLVP